MPLRIVLDAHDETLQEMYLASEARYIEGRTLLQAYEYDGAIYLLGLSAEMLLKLALYRLDASVKLTDNVDAGWGRLASTWRTLFPGLKVDAHDIFGLYAILEYEHRRRFGGYSLEVDRDFYRCISRLYDNWWISMRYRGKHAVSVEAEQVLEDVEWLRANHNKLRS